MTFEIKADFEADNEVDNSSIGNKKTNVYKQMPVCNGFFNGLEINDVLQGGFYDYLLGCDDVEWFVDEFIKLEKKMNFIFKSIRKENNMTQEDEELFRRTYVCFLFVRKFLVLKKLEIVANCLVNVQAQHMKIVMKTISRIRVFCSISIP